MADPPDCSAQLLSLTSTTSVLVEPSEIQLLEVCIFVRDIERDERHFFFLWYWLPSSWQVNVTDQQKQARAELRISSSITSEINADSLALPFVLLSSEHPKLYVKFGSYPNESSYDFMQPFFHHVAEVHVPASMVSPGTW